MNKEKQIEEMAKVFCGMKNGCDGCMWNKAHCHERNYAEELYNAGYRKQEWISVEDRLPEDNGRYLIFDASNIGISWYKKKDEYYSYIWRNNFTHWMPLPEAPKMRKDDEGK